MASIAELELKLEKLRAEYASIRIISQSDPGPIMERRAIQREMNHTERKITELKAKESNNKI
jgi:hypothetical protein